MRNVLEVHPNIKAIHQVSDARPSKIKEAACIHAKVRNEKGKRRREDADRACMPPQPANRIKNEHHQ